MMNKEDFTKKFLEMQKQRRIQKRLEENKELIQKKRNEYIQLNNYQMDKLYRLS